MCCFSGKVNYVKSTKIFARANEKGDAQFVVYSMELGSKNDIAMILPIPVKHATGEKAVKFISLEGYPRFFRDMQKGFPAPPRPRNRSSISRDVASDAKLAVVSVGSFEASFVPTMNDFDRLDERFRLPSGTWDKLPAYSDYGFAVFKLKKGNQKVHPMAFRFPRANPKQLFFPTVHIHDGEIHARAKFDHVLYCQLGEFDAPPMLRWRESPGHPGSFMEVHKTNKIVKPDAHCYRIRLAGSLRNQDTLV